MTELPASAVAGLPRHCPHCDAAPNEPCIDKFGRTRQTTHQERKDAS